MRNIRKRTLANVWHWRDEQVDALRRVLEGQGIVGVEDAVEVVRSLPHGHVSVAGGDAAAVKPAEMIDHKRSRRRELAVAMIAARVLEPQSKLATARGLNQQTSCDGLRAALGIDDVLRRFECVYQRPHRAGMASSTPILTSPIVTAIFFRHHMSLRCAREREKELPDPHRAAHSASAAVGGAMGPPCATRRHAWRFCAKKRPMPFCFDSACGHTPTAHRNCSYRGQIKNLSDQICSDSN